MRKNILAIFYVLLLLLAPISSGRAADNVPSGVIRVGNRAYQDATLSFDAELSGDSVRGQLAVAVFTESGQFRNCSFYPAASAVNVCLQDVSGTDFVKNIWLDDDFCPLATPMLLRMPDNGAVAYANFADDLRNLMEHSAGAGAEASDPGNPYALARLIVRCDALPDLSRFPMTGRAQGPDGLYVLQFQNAAWAEQCAAYLRTCSSVRYVEPDAVIQQPDSASLSAYGEGAESPYLSWGAETAGIGKYAERLAQDEDGDGVAVAVVDSGVDLGHPFLTGRLLPGRDILYGNSEPQDEFGHGTHVAGIIVDCTPNLNVKILPVRTLDAAGVCGSLALMASAIRWAADNGANVINLSLSAPASACIDEAVQYAIDKNITVVAAAGNQYVDTDNRSPARVPDAITVVAVNAANGRFPYSNYGDAVDLSAPGEGVLSAYLCGQGDNGGDYRTLSGTSMAAPHVSAAAALLLCERGVSQTPAQISATLREVAIDMGAPGWDRYYGAGTLNMLPFVPQPEPLFYALLYANGELAFQKTQTPDDGRTALHTYPVLPESHGHAEYAAWYEQRNNIKKVTLSETVRPESTALWFYDCANLTEISGLERLDTSGVTNMSQMFSLCENLTELDLTAFDTAKVTDMSQMFFGCGKLETVYASEQFSTDAVVSDADMFDGCAALVGGRGIVFDPAHTDNAYARLDGGLSAPGYFTDKSAQYNNIYAVLYSDDEGNGELVFQNNNRTDSEQTVTGVYTVDKEYFLYDENSNTASTPWYEQRENITTVTFADEIQPDSTACWFWGCEKLTSLRNIQKLDTANVTDMFGMFAFCRRLANVDVRGFNTSNVTNMEQMFYLCTALTNIDVSSFNTSNVTTMSWMFFGCIGLRSLDVGNFDTSHVVDMRSMFADCYKLNSLDVSGFNTSNVVYMGAMFGGCHSLTSLDVSGFNTSNAVNMWNMFGNCYELTSLDVSGFDTANVVRMGYVFCGCSGLTALDVSGFDTANVTDMSSMFYGCSGLTALNVTRFDTANVTDMSRMFSDCSGLTALDVSSFDTANVTDIADMFRGCSNLKTIYASDKFTTASATGGVSLMFYDCASLVGGVGTSYSDAHTNEEYARIDGGASAPGYFTDKNASSVYAILYSDGELVFQYGDAPESGKTVTKTYKVDLDAVYTGYPTYYYAPWHNERESIRIVNFADKISPKATAYWFHDCGKVTEIQNIRNLDTSNVTTMKLMFWNCSELTTLDLSHFNTANVTDMCEMFGNCSGLTALDLSKFNTANVTDMNYMFHDCRALTTLDLSNFDTANVTSMRQMFEDCTGLTTLNISHWDNANVTTMKLMFSYCTALTVLDLSHFNTSNVKDMSEMFNGCNALTTLDLSGFDTANVTNMTSMFYGCSALTELDVSRFNTANVKYMGGMFSHCSSLTTLDVSHFDTANVENMDYTFYQCGKLKTIYASEKFNIMSVLETSAHNTRYMFTDCTALVGGAGTRYDSSHTDKEYARIDGGASAPGYFTDKNAPIPSDDIYAVLYADGELVFQNNDRTDSARSVTDVYAVDKASSSNSYAPWYGQRDNIATATFADKIQPASTAYWFYECQKLTRIWTIANLDTGNVTDMNNMFSRCFALTTLDLSGFDTSNVTNMKGMFSSCLALASLNVSGFDTSKVTNMNGMFSSCAALASLDVSGFDTSNVTNIGGMFYNCSALTSLDVSGFNTEKATSMLNMFFGCARLSSLDLSGFKTGNVKNMGGMFDGCAGLIHLDLSGFDTGNVQNMLLMFNACSSLTNLDISQFNTANVTGMIHMFYDCGALKTIYASASFVTDKVSDNYGMFEGCASLVGGSGTKYDSAHTDKEYARIDGGPSAPGYFTDKNAPLPSNDIYAVLYADGELVFQNNDRTDSGRSVTDVYKADKAYSSSSDVPWYGQRDNIVTVAFADKIQPASTAYWFFGCEELTEIRNIEQMDTSNVTNMERMFWGCGELTSCV